MLEISGISKQFKLFHRGLPYLSMRDKIIDIFRSREEVEQFWALRDVSFSVNRGDSVGIIGRNGAGKSTLLKILSRITPPTTGSIICRGTLASLLEVGTGFHQELSGRENIYMNGSILGMKKTEIDRRFDEIVDFSGTEKFLDTPLKHYSSGMQLRLAFAVAAHLESEILIIDEVLAVGDAEFQKKCIRKMEDVTGQGRTLLFVSHNLPTLKAICRTGVLLGEGKLVAQGSIDEVIDIYSQFHRSQELITNSIHYYQPHIKVHEVVINGSATNSVIVDNDRLHIRTTVEFMKRTNFELDVHFKKQELPVASYANFVNHEVEQFEPGIYDLNYEIRLPALRSGKYRLDLFFTEPFASWFAVSENIIEVDVINGHHHTFLNNANLKWGTTLLEGSMSRHKRTS
ncbi:MAG: ABC transporter ATP-binding protein [Cyclobacteriaceae bacterium]|nr:ABC transporter ATP-binding protein [Cyclobacteriaceae bacterium]